MDADMKQATSMYRNRTRRAFDSGSEVILVLPVIRLICMHRTEYDKSFAMVVKEIKEKGRRRYYLASTLIWGEATTVPEHLF
jgi:hypothetical protein